MKYKKRMSAFTLVELLVVISIIAMLLAILMPSLQKVRQQAKKMVCLTQLRQIGMSCNIYAAKNDNRIPDRLNSSDPFGSYKVFMGSYGWANHGTFYRDGYLPDMKILWCPSAPSSGIYRYWSKSYNLNRNFVKAGEAGYIRPELIGNYLVPASSQPDSSIQDPTLLRSGYLYRGNFLNKLVENKKVTDYSSHLAIAMDIFMRSGIKNAWHANGYNVAYMDGSGRFCEDKNQDLLWTYNFYQDAPKYSQWGPVITTLCQKQGWRTPDWLGARAVWATLDQGD